MKKIIAGVLASALFVTGSLQAFAEYIGDVQARVGYESVTVTYEGETDSQKGDDYFFGVANYNLFRNPGDSFSFGCTEQLTFGYGSILHNKDALGFSAGLLVGPALGIQIGEILRVQAGFGLDVLFYDVYYSKNKYTSNNYAWDFGAGLDLQLQVLPENFISPVVGMRFSTISSDKLYTYEDYDGESESDDVDIDMDLVSWKFYVGASLKF